ncbi:hypothetical protein CLV84_1704 [Neolewinella xylanilytica]|uniref:Uncharacterized protein n=1 Tax=Neolewinella xylanilytica TaxID=1514080 RepID=A0A2S6IB43_9BACT|nr:hypothetical protein [Neolewinella xylanilytica]PPK88733.1 hypothetical protein CLV84_1704 [Neolewinella xylanilytica]
MRTYEIFFLFGCLSLVACGPPDSPAEVMVPGKDYVLTEGKPLGYLQIGGSYAGFRLRIDRDTAHLFSPFHGHGERLPAYAGDSLATFGDPQYMVYDRRPDSSLVAVLRDSSGIIGRQRYELIDELATNPLAESATGKTYRFAIDGQAYYAYFEAPPTADAVQETRVQLYTLTDSSGRISRIAGGMGNRSAYASIPVYFPYRPDLTEGRRGVLLFSGDESGAPQVHMNYDGGADYTYLSGPYELTEQVSPLPEGIGARELVNLMNRSNITTELLTPEPAREALQYAYLEDFWRLGGIEAGEAGQLDFEFREEGGFTMFCGDRVLTRGSWSLSPDRNFFILSDETTQHRRHQFIDGYDGSTLTLTVPVRVKTKLPYGTELQSYYDGLAEVRFSR